MNNTQLDQKKLSQPLISDRIINIQKVIKTTFTDIFKDQVDLLCQKINNVEWSGILFYKSTGIFPNIKIELQEILLMHKGTATYTEYEYDEDVVIHQMNNPYLLGSNIGHIHSHNSMNAFFSSTDLSELQDNAKNHLYYLSIIVNNVKDVCGKLCVIAETEKANQYSYKIQNSENKTLMLENNVKENVLLVCDCDIKTLNTESKNIKQDFIDRIEKITKKSEPVITKCHLDENWWNDNDSFSHYSDHNSLLDIRGQNSHRNFDSLGNISKKNKKIEESIPLSDFINDENIEIFFIYILSNRTINLKLENYIFRSDDDQFVMFLYNNKDKIVKNKNFFNIFKSSFDKYWIDYIKKGAFTDNIFIDEELKVYCIEKFCEDLYLPLIKTFEIYPDFLTEITNLYNELNTIIYEYSTDNEI